MVELDSRGLLRKLAFMLAFMGEIAMRERFWSSKKAPPATPSSNAMMR